MKALTVCQPYAELIANGDKPIENRTWPTKYRGPLAIHAGKSKAWLESHADAHDFVFGAVVAVADLVACLPLIYPADGENWPEPWRHLAQHHHANGPWCWVLSHVRRLSSPIPCRGAQGLWEFQENPGTRGDVR